MKVFQGPNGENYILSDPDDDVIEFLEASFASSGKRLDIIRTGECWMATVARQDNPQGKSFLNFISYEDDYEAAKYEIYAAMIEALPADAEVPEERN